MILNSDISFWHRASREACDLGFEAWITDRTNWAVQRRQWCDFDLWGWRRWEQLFFTPVKIEDIFEFNWQVVLLRMSPGIWTINCWTTVSNIVQWMEWQWIGWHWTMSEGSIWTLDLCVRRAIQTPLNPTRRCSFWMWTVSGRKLSAEMY